MGILLAFAPFLVFALADRFIQPDLALGAAAFASAILIMRQLITRRAPKILEIGTLILFAGLALYVKFAAPDWTVIAVRLRVDAGLLIIILISMAIGRPFTLQYAREETPPEIWTSPEFLRTNYVVTAAWALAFAIMIAAELAILYVPTLPHRIGVLAIIAALYSAAKFTSWYPERGKNKE